MSSLQAQQEETELFRSLLARIKSDEELSLPRETLQGAISHYLATRPAHDRTALVNAIIDSKSIWSGDKERVAVIQHSFASAVLYAVDNLRLELEGAYFAQRRVNRKARTWLSSIAQPTIDVEESRPATIVLIGILEGLKSVPEVDWAHWPSLLEQELVLAAAMSSDQGGDVDLFVSVLTLVSDDYLKALDLEAVIAPTLQRTLIQSIKTGGTEQTGRLAEAYGRCLRVQSTSLPKHREAAWTAISKFLDEIRALLNDATTSAAVEGFVPVARRMVDILINETTPSSIPSTSSSLPTAVLVATHILLILLRLAPSTQPEDEDRSWEVAAGCLDIIEAESGGVGINSVFQIIQQTTEGRLEPKASDFVIKLVTETLGLVDIHTVRDIVLPLLESRLCNQSESDAAQETVFDFVEKIAEKAKGNVDQESFFKTILSSFANLYLARFQSAPLTDELAARFPQAYSSIGKCAIPSVVYELRQKLDTLPRTTTDPAKAQVARMTQIALAPYVGLDDLPDYLTGLAWNILDTQPWSAERDELAESAFNMALQELPDEGRQAGMEWWLKWRDEILGMTVPVQAKL